jgi:adenylate kinase
MFREMKTLDTPLAREVQEIMASGKLISDDVTYKIVRERTSRDDCKNGYILDGYPRTAVQAKQLEELAKEQGNEIRAIEVDVPKDELMRRLTGRRSCPVCGEIYNIYSKPPKIEGFCDIHPQDALTHRADDNEESVKTRLDTYEENMKPLIDYYENSGRLSRVDGTGEVEEIYSELEKLF